MSYQKEVGKVLRKIRREMDMSQKDFGELIGITGGAWSNKETGKTATTITDLKIIADFAEIRIGWILEQAERALTLK